MRTVFHAPLIISIIVQVGILLILGRILPLPLVDAAKPACERLKATLTYTQEEAPRDLSGLVSHTIITKRMDIKGGKVGNHCCLSSSHLVCLFVCLFFFG